MATQEEFEEVVSAEETIDVHQQAPRLERIEMDLKALQEEQAIWKRRKHYLLGAVGGLGLLVGFAIGLAIGNSSEDDDEDEIEVIDVDGIVLD